MSLTPHNPGESRSADRSPVPGSDTSLPSISVGSGVSTYRTIHQQAAELFIQICRVEDLSPTTSLDPSFDRTALEALVEQVFELERANALREQNSLPPLVVEVHGRAVQPESGKIYRLVSLHPAGDERCYIKGIDCLGAPMPVDAGAFVGYLLTAERESVREGVISFNAAGALVLSSQARHGLEIAYADREASPLMQAVVAASSPNGVYPTNGEQPAVLLFPENTSPLNKLRVMVESGATTAFVAVNTGDFTLNHLAHREVGHYSVANTDRVLEALRTGEHWIGTDIIRAYRKTCQRQGFDSLPTSHPIWSTLESQDGSLVRIMRELHSSPTGRVALDLVAFNVDSSQFAVLAHIANSDDSFLLPCGGDRPVTAEGYCATVFAGKREPDGQITLWPEAFIHEPRVLYQHLLSLASGRNTSLLSEFFLQNINDQRADRGDESVSIDRLSSRISLLNRSTDNYLLGILVDDGSDYYHYVLPLDTFGTIFLPPSQDSLDSFKLENTYRRSQSS